ncbi:hypothetical protein Cni_G06505 [Canna indica]|uniref:Uncharacterized protein n=1 Tax=Canna indica TaxID=4628 RepID=A0AAQ3JX65_9LILI|nr:hypothetical protein Cni_G06505 [Canna indica]
MHPPRLHSSFLPLLLLLLLNCSCSSSTTEKPDGIRGAPIVRISTGLLTNLKGISVKVLFFWLNIIEVRFLDDSLRFSVGIASTDFALNNFYISPQLGCGLDCPDDDDVVTRSPLHLTGRHLGALDRS